MPVRSKNQNLSAAEIEKLQQKEYWHKLVIKIILWREDQFTTISGLREKVTLKEWKTYCQQTLKTNVTYGKLKVNESLRQTWQEINKNGGFEKD